MGKIHGSRVSKKSLVFLAVLAIAALCVSAAAFFRPDPVVPGADAPQPTITRTPQTEPQRVSLTESAKRLDDPSRPFNLVVLGDSTGSDADAWPALVGQWISEEYGRPVTLLPWSEGAKPPSYQAPRELGAGTNAPVTIYNGSAPSRNATYSLSEIDKMIPVDMATIDLVLISHGHNHGPESLVGQVHPLVMELTQRAPGASIALVLQNPEKDGSPHAAIQDANTEGLRLYADRFSLDSVDVRNAYREHGDFGSLYKDNVHPVGADGYRIWADTVIAALSDRH